MADNDNTDGRGAPASESGTVRRLKRAAEVSQGRARAVREASDAADEVLRAANEELRAVNSELKRKFEAISRAYSDLQNLVAAIDFGTLFLDSGLRLKRFTERVTDLFSITPTDEGRLITDCAHKLEYDDLINDARTVLADLAPIRREVRSRAGRWYDMRIRPYLTDEDKIDGIVVTFIEVSDQHRVQQALRRHEELLQQQKHLIDLSRDPIFVWDFDNGIVDWNRGSEQLYGFSRDEALGKGKEQLLGTTVPGSSFAELKAKLLRDRSWAGELRQKTKSGDELTVESRLQLENFNGRRLVLESTRDVTARRASERRLQLLLGELTHRVRNTLAVVQAIARHSMRNSKTKEDFAERFEARLSALASAHSLLVSSDWKGADFADLARQQLAPYITDNPDRLRLQGPSLSLPADLATPFGLVLHELATNAAKYGSLSVGAGTVSLSWTISETNPQRSLKVVWEESGAPNATETRSEGMGSALIDRVIPGAQVEREYQPGGLLCTIELPMPELTQDAGAAN